MLKVNFWKIACVKVLPGNSSLPIFPVMKVRNSRGKRTRLKQEYIMLMCGWY